MSDDQTPVQKDPVLEQLIADNDWLEIDCPNDVGGAEIIEGAREGVIYPIGDAGYQFIFWGDESIIHGFKVKSDGESVIPLTPTTQIIGYRDNRIKGYEHSLGYAERRERLMAANAEAIIPPMPESLKRLQTE